MAFVSRPASCPDATENFPHTTRATRALATRGWSYEHADEVAQTSQLAQLFHRVTATAFYCRLAVQVERYHEQEATYVGVNLNIQNLTPSVPMMRPGMLHVSIMKIWRRLSDPDIGALAATLGSMLLGLVPQDGLSLVNLERHKLWKKSWCFGIDKDTAVIMQSLRTYCEAWCAARGLAFRERDFHVSWH